MTVPGIGWVTAYTIASEIGDIRRFASPKKLTGYTGLCPLVRQSGNHDYRGPLSSMARYLRWALIEAAPTPLEISVIAIAMSGPSAVSDPAWFQGRPRRCRPPAGRGHLAHPDQERTLAPAGPAIKLVA